MSLLSALGQATPPSAAVEFASDRVAAAVLQMRAGSPVVAGVAAEPLRAGALAPSLTAANVRDRGAVSAALARVLDRLGARVKRVGLVIPDPATRISLLRFEQVPASAHDLDQLVRWQIRKTAPFPIEEAQVSYVPGERSGEGHEFIVSVARRSVIEEYESLAIEAGLNPGLVDICSFSVVNLALARSTPSGDWLLINVASDYASLAILRGGDLIFFRNRTAESEGSLVDLVHQATMYYEDRLQGRGLIRVVLAGGGSERSERELEEARRTLQGRFEGALEALDPSAIAPQAERIGTSAELRHVMTPLVGLLLRDHDVAA